MDHDDLRAWLRLTFTPGLGREAGRRLLAAFGSAPAVFAQSAQALVECGSDKLAKTVLSEPPKLQEQWQRTLDWLAAGADRRIATLGDSAYPTALLDIEDPPLMLYMLGSMALQPDAASGRAGAPRLAIVGSRNPTPQGEVNAREFAKTFGTAGWCVVSGLALGIDGAAHDGALLGGGETIAVVGTGLDRVYPKQHLALAHRIAERGMMVSEFPLGTMPLMHNFPMRNRIISGLSQGTLVVEAALKSGSLITARLAVEQGKEVFAIPGSIHSPQSRGCHALIKQGAKLVELAEDVLEELIPAGQARPSPLSPSSPPDPAHRTPGRASPPPAEVSPVGLADEQDPLVRALGFDAVSLDALQARTGLDTPRLQAELLTLELDGIITRLPGGLFQRMASS